MPTSISPSPDLTAALPPCEREVPEDSLRLAGAQAARAASQEPLLERASHSEFRFFHPGLRVRVNVARGQRSV